MKSIILFSTIILTSCGLGHKEVRYTELVVPPRVTLNGGDIILTIGNSTENPSFKIYEIQPNIDEGEKIILLKVHAGMGREAKKEFRIRINNIKQDSVSDYKIFWIDPDNKKTELPIER